MFDGPSINIEDIDENATLGNITGLFRGSPVGEENVNRGSQGMGKNLGIGVGSREGAGFVGRACGTFWVVEVGFGEEPKKGVVEIGRKGITANPKDVAVVKMLAANGGELRQAEYGMPSGPGAESERSCRRSSNLLCVSSYWMSWGRGVEKLLMI